MRVKKWVEGSSANKHLTVFLATLLSHWVQLKIMFIFIFHSLFSVNNSPEMTLKKRQIKPLWKGNGNENTKWTSMLTADKAVVLFFFDLQRSSEGF